MYTFRFNPVCEQWVLLGTPVPTDLSIKPSHLLDVGKRDGFMAATYPRQPFILDAERPKQHSPDRLYADQQPVGEYELLLAEHQQPFFKWQAAQWEAWLSLVQQRIVQFHHNPQLHYLYLALDTGALDTAGKNYQRVGDLVAVSHPVFGEDLVMTAELAEKICARESIYTVAENEYGRLQVPSAPLHEHEAWYIPKRQVSGIEQLTKQERKALAETLADFMAVVHDEWPEDRYLLTLHTSLAAKHRDLLWWVQIHKKTGDLGALPVRPLPERFVRDLALRFKKAG